jgi:hypothetical protein
MARHAFRPRYRGLAWGSIGIGGVLAAFAWWSPPVVLVSAICGLGFGATYMLSPTWKLTVVTSEDALTVEAGGKVRFSLPWKDVHKVIAAPTTKTCFVDGGTADRRIMIPGDGAPAPNRIDRREELYDWIVAHVPADKIETVELISDRMKDD